MKAMKFKSTASIFSCLILINTLLITNVFADRQNSDSSNSSVKIYIQKYQDGKKQYRFSNVFSSFDIQVKGDISVNDDDTGIKSISPGGYIKISKRTFGNKRTIIIESNTNGELSYEYYEGRKEIPFEPEGRKWLADVLLELIHITGIDAVGRTKRIYRQKGIDGFIEEIHVIPSNSVMAKYFEALLENISLNDYELVSACSTIASEISSNTERGRLFRKYSNLFMKNNTTAVVYFQSISKLSSNTERGSILKNISTKIDFEDPKVTEAYFACVDKMTSNTERGSVLRNLEKTQKLNNQAYARLLMSVKKFSSNTEMGSVMRSLDKLDMNNSPVNVAYFNAIDGMTSNTEAGSTLRHLIKHSDLNEINYVNLLRSVKKLTSNTEMGSVLRTINFINLKNQDVNEAYFLAIRSMTSNTEAGSVLRYTIKTYDLNDKSWIQLFNETGRLSSNTEMASVLITASEFMPYDNKSVIDAFFNAVNRFSSNTEHGRVLKKVIANEHLNKFICYKILESVKKMSSNTEKSSVMIKLSHTKFIKDPEIRKLYKTTAGSLTSNTDYRRVIEAID